MARRRYGVHLGTPPFGVQASRRPPPAGHQTGQRLHTTPRDNDHERRNGSHGTRSRPAVRSPQSAPPSAAPRRRGAGLAASASFEALAARQRVWANARIAVPTVLVLQCSLLPPRWHTWICSISAAG